MGRLSKFGPSVIGQQKFEEEQEIRKNPVQRFGPAVLGDMPAQAEPQAAAGAISEDLASEIDVSAIPGFSVEDAREALAANPALVDAFFEAEKVRKPQPRKGVLHALLQAEGNREGGEREAVVAELTALLSPEG